MKCKEIRTVTKRRSVLSLTAATEVANHIKSCAACQNLLLLDKLAPAIIKAASNSYCESICESINNGPSVALISKIRNRIQEIRDQRSVSWELAIEAMRGWLAAFAATAIILIAVSIQWRPSAMTSDFDHEGDELAIQNPAEYLISDVPDPTNGQ